MQTKVQDVDLRQNIVADLYLRGNSLRFIAGLLKTQHGVSVTFQTIHNDVKHLREVWKAERMEAYESGLAIELEKLDRVELAAWQGWDRSLKEGHKRTKKKGKETLQVDTYEADGAGDPRFLAIITKVSEQRSRLLGLFKSQPIDTPADIPVQDNALPPSFSDNPTFVIVGGSKPMIESEENLPED